jgi:hypothetical protein
MEAEFFGIIVTITFPPRQCLRNAISCVGAHVLTHRFVNWLRYNFSSTIKRRVSGYAGRIDLDHPTEYMLVLYQVREPTTT